MCSQLADPCGRALRLGSVVTRLLGLQFRIPPGPRMSVSCERYVLSGEMSLRLVDHTSRGVLLSVLCLSVISKPPQ
jgi:hypothetical protein